MSEQEKETPEVEIPEAKVEEATEIIGEESFAGLTSGERKMAEKLDIKVQEPVKEEKKEEPKETPKEEPKVEQKEEPKEEFVEKSKDEINSLTPKEKGFYFKAKEERAKAIKAKLEADSTKLKLRSLEQRLEELSKPKEEVRQEFDDILNKPDDEIITAGELKKFVQKQQEDSLKARERDEAERKAASINFARSEKAKILDNIAKEKVSDWDTVAEMAKEVMANDKTGVYKERFIRLMDSPNQEENIELIEFVENLGKLHPEANKKLSAKKEEVENEEVERVEKNLSKKPSSAAIGGSGSRKIAESDLTIDDAMRMIEHDSDSWRKLRPETRRRLLGD